MEIQEYRLKTFIDTELKVFSNHDNVRSIPSLIDGFKDSQRKAIYGAIQHGTSEIKVAQLAAYCSLNTRYQHGESSLGDTIVGIAQNFTGSNNVNLLEPIGQFGSILSPESAAHRYIYTKQSSNLRKYIRKEDDPILVFREEEGVQLEPIQYFPILPMWIVNGVVGIGTGHSVKILSRDPKKVSQLVSKMVAGVTVQQKTIDQCLTPHFNGWKGEVISLGGGSFELRGSYEIVNKTTIRVRTLPIGYDVDKYKAILIKLMDKGLVKDFDNNSTESGFDFILNVPREFTAREPQVIHDTLKLSTSITENVTLWGVDGKLRRYQTVYEALQEFVKHRLDVYGVRKERQLEIIAEDLSWLKARSDFIVYWNTKMVDPHKKGKEELFQELSGVVPTKYIDRLVSLQIRSLTMESLNDLKKQITDLETQQKTLSETSIQELYVADLKEL